MNILENQSIISFPRMGNIHIAMKKMFEGMGAKVILPPENNKAALTLGTRHSVEGICIPYKLNLGNYIQALDAGANALVMLQAPGTCRLGTYVQNQKMKLEELGYKFDMIVFDMYKGKFFELVKTVSVKSTNKITPVSGINSVLLGLETFNVLDKIEESLFWHRPREINKGDSEKVYKRGLKLIDKCKDRKELKLTTEKILNEFKKIPIDESKEILKVHITGEFFVLLDPFTNMDIEKELGHMGVQVERQVMMSHWINSVVFPKWLYNHESHKDRAVKTAKDYMTRIIGGDCLESIGDTVHASKNNADGVVHIGPFGCIPEVVSQCVLPHVSKQEDIPVISLNVDEHTGKAGFVTRLEAFVDLLKRRKKVKISV